MFDALTVSVVLIVLLTLFGQSIGVSMIGGTIVYLAMKGFDTSIAAETGSCKGEWRGEAAR